MTLDLSLFSSPAPNLYVLEKWDWSYLEAEAFQLKCVEFVQQNPHICIFLFCSHPHCFTMGRGLQKVKDPNVSLVEFDRQTSLPFPLYDIKRGGGLTFHYPGQLVFYPIVSTTHHKIPVNDLMIKILDLTKDALNKILDPANMKVRKDLLGLWYRNDFLEAKIASIGLAASRFVTYHGLALNLTPDKEMFQALSLLHPCGLTGTLYSDIESLAQEPISQLLKKQLASELTNKLSTSLLSQRELSASMPSL